MKSSDASKLQYLMLFLNRNSVVDYKSYTDKYLQWIRIENNFCKCIKTYP